MKKFVLVITLAALTLSAAAFAQDPIVWEGNQDNIGLYFDEAASNLCDTAPVGYFTCYLTITNVTSGSVGGWEAKPTMEGGAAIILVSPRATGQWFNAATRMGEYIIGFAEPQVPVAGNLVIGEVLVQVLSAAVPGFGYVEPVYFHSLPEALPAYIDGVDPLVIKRLLPRSGQVSDAQIVINGECGPVANEDASFGAVKALFR